MKLFLVFYSIFFSALTFADTNCGFEAVKDSAFLEWTAFKTTEKLPVKGTFKDLNLIKIRKDKRKALTLEDWMKSHSFAINIKSVDTDNPERDKTLFDNFFNLMKTSLKHLPGDKFINGKVKSIDSKSGTLVATINMNSVQRDIPMSFKFAENTLELTGSLDILDFSLKEAHKALHKACFELHKGSDGVSKTWTQVDLKGRIKLENPCK